MKDANDVVRIIIEKFRKLGVAEGRQKSFGYVRETPKAVIVSREDGEDTPVPRSKIAQGIEFYRDNLEKYDEGPKALEECGLTHITSPIWALIHLITKNDLLED